MPASRVSFYTPLGFPNEQRLLIKQNFTFLSKPRKRSSLSIVPSKVPVEQDARFQSLAIHILQGPCKGDPPPGSPRRAPIDSDAPCPKPSFICLSRGPGKRKPPLGSPTGPLWREMFCFQSQWFIHSFTSLRVPHSRSSFTKWGKTYDHRARNPKRTEGQHRMGCGMVPQVDR